MSIDWASEAEAALRGAGANPSPSGAVTASGPVPDNGISYGPYEAETSGVPAWLARDYDIAKQEYAAALLAMQNADLSTQSAASARLTNARLRLTSLDAQLDNYVPKPAAKGTYFEDDYSNRFYQPEGPVAPVPVWTNPDATTRRQLDIDKARADIDKARAAIAASNAAAAASAASAAKGNQPNIQVRGRDVLSIDPWTGAVKSTYQLPQEEITPYQQAVLEGDKETNRLSALKADQEREAANLRNLSTNYTSAWNQALAFQLPEGQDYWTGFEPGGVQEQLMKRYGLNYTAPKATRVPFNPWQVAAQQVKGG